MLLLSFFLFASLASPHPLDSRYRGSNIRKRQDWVSEFSIDEFIMPDVFPTFSLDFSFLSVSASPVFQPSPTTREAIVSSAAPADPTKPTHHNLHSRPSKASLRKNLEATRVAQDLPAGASHPQHKGVSSSNAVQFSKANSRPLFPSATAVHLEQPRPALDASATDDIRVVHPLQQDGGTRQDVEVPQGHTGPHNAHVAGSDQNDNLQQNSHSQHGENEQSNGHAQQHERIQQVGHTHQGLDGVPAGSRPITIPSTSDAQIHPQPIITHLSPPPPGIHQVVTATSTVYAPDPMQSGLKYAAETRHSKAIIIASILAVILSALVGAYFIVYMLSRRRRPIPIPVSPYSPASDSYGAHDPLIEKNKDDVPPDVSYTGLLLARDSCQLHSPSRYSMGSQRRAHSLPVPGKGYQEYHLGSRWSISSSDFNSARRFSMELRRWRHIRGVLSFGSGLAQRASLLIRNSIASDHPPKSPALSRRSTNVPLLSPQEFFVLDDEGGDDDTTSRRSLISLCSETTTELPYDREQF